MAGSDETLRADDLAALKEDVGDAYAGRTVLVTGADGFMGSHVTEALVRLGARVHVFVRATSSGALHNIGHLRQDVSVHWGDLTDRLAVDSAVKALASASDPPFVFHLGAQAHVGESWLRPYETLTTNVLGTLNLLQSIVDHRVELEKLSTSGTSEEYGNVRDGARTRHSFDDDGGLVLHEESPLNPKSVYATSKLAADFLTVNFHDAYGVPAVVTRMFNTYGPRQNPRYITGTIITQALEREVVEIGNLEPERDFVYCGDSVRAHLLVGATRSSGRRLLLRPGRAHRDRRLGGAHPAARRRGGFLAEARARKPAGALPAWRERRDGAAMRLHSADRADGLAAKALVGGGVLRTIRWFAEDRDRWLGRVDWQTAELRNPVC